MKRIRYGITLALTFFMLLAADIRGAGDVVVIDACALAFGLLCTDRLQWKTDKAHTVAVTALSAFAGAAIENFLPAPVYFKIIAAFAVCGLILIITDCKLMCAVSIGTAPVIFGYSGWTYPIAATAAAAVICVIWHIMIHAGIKEAPVRFRYLPDFEADTRMWLIMTAAAAIICVYPAWWKKLAYITPPLTTFFVEGCYRNLKGKRFRIWFVAAVAAVTGAMAEFLLSGILGIPMCISGTIAVGITLLEMRLMSMPFAPVCSVALVPFAAETDFILFAPMCAAGCAIVLAAAAFVRGMIIKREVRHG